MQGSVKVFSLKELNDVYKAMNKIGVNLNQIATVVNSTGNVYQKDIEDILTEMKQLRIIVDDWLSPLEAEYANWTSLKRGRNISDKIALEHGLNNAAEDYQKEYRNSSKILAGMHMFMFLFSGLGWVKLITEINDK